MVVVYIERTMSVGFINICHNCKAAVEPDFDAIVYKAYVCPHCRKQFTDTYAIDSKEWEKWSEEKRKEYIAASLQGKKKEFFEKYPVAVDKKAQAKSRVTLFVIMALCLLIGIACLSSVPIVSIFCFAIIGFFICLLLSVKKDLTTNFELSDIIRYDATSFTIHLFKRDPRVAEHVKVTDDENIHIKHEPVKLHVGAVSVGGVTTGGAYTTGGYNYISGRTKSGYAKIIYKGNPVSYIQLSDELYEQAKDSPVAEYLNHSTKSICAFGQGTFSEADYKQMLTNHATTGFIGNFDQTKATFSQCELIVGWMCGRL